MISIKLVLRNHIDTTLCDEFDGSYDNSDNDYNDDYDSDDDINDLPWLPAAAPMILDLEDNESFENHASVAYPV